MSTFSKLVREPLVQFFVIGLALFAVDRTLRDEAIDPRTIIVDAALQQHLSDLFFDARGVRPTRAEFDEMLETHLKNEVLYREARALDLDQGDDMVRERLAQKMRVLIYGGVVIDEPDEATLRAFFEARKDDFTTPATISFRVIGVDGDEAEAAEIAAGANERAAAGQEAEPRGYRLIGFKNRPYRQMERLFDATFIEAIAAQPAGEWRATPSVRGWQATEYLGGTAASTPSFDEAQSAIRDEWRQDQLQRAAREALSRMRDEYPIQAAPIDPALLSGDAPAPAAGAAQ